MSAQSRQGHGCHSHSALRHLRFESLEDRVLLAADLIANDIGVSDSTVNPGQSITVTWTAKNVGDSATGSFPFGTSQQGVLWSMDTSITKEGDRLLEQEFLGWLDDGRSTPESHTVNIPEDATPGESYWIGVIADYDGDVSESNENNNNDGIAVQVTVNHADLDILSVALDEASNLWYIGDNIDAEVTVKNIGTATANDANVEYYLGTLANRTMHSLGSGQLGGIFPLNDISPDETATDWIGSPLPGGGWTISDHVSPGTDYSIWARATTDSADSNSDNDWDRSARFSIQSRLSWRDGTAAEATIVDTIHAGQIVYARVDGTPGEQFEIEIWEDDDALGDDKIDTFSMTVGPGGFATSEWAAAWQGDDGDDPQNQYYLSDDGPLLLDEDSATLDVSVQAVLGVNSFTNRLSYDWGDSRPGEGVIDVTLDRLDSGAPIDPTMQTWVVIHGRNGSFDEAEDRVKQLAPDQAKAKP